MSSASTAVARVAYIHKIVRACRAVERRPTPVIGFSGRGEPMMVIIPGDDEYHTILNGGEYLLCMPECRICKEV